MFIAKRLTTLVTMAATMSIAATLAAPAGAGATVEPPEATPTAGPVENAAEASGGATAAARTNRFWIYGETEQSGYKKSYSGSDPRFANDEWDGTAISVDNGADSAFNDTTRYVILWTEPGYAGSGQSFPSGATFVDLGDPDIIGRNTASSVEFL
uniref:peptidase inhibitor family I36 protein n=1 Tax=Nonomuraea sp. CA-252377 TaxID=3240003 RepID=UPI003F4991D6